MSADLATRDENVVTLRRNVVLHGVVGGLALIVGGVYLARGSVLDVLVGLVVLAIAGLNLPALISPSTPLLVLDDQGIRFRVGLTWRGLPWRAVRQVVVEEPRSLLRDGRLVIVARDPEDVIGDLDLLGRAHLRWNEFWYGAPISLPLGITTTSDVSDLTAELTALGKDRIEIVVLTADDEFDEFSEDAPEEVTAPVDLPAAVLPLRDLSSPARVEVRLEAPSVPHQRVDADDLPADLDGEVTEYLDLPRWDQEVPVEIVTEALPEPVRADPVIGLKVLHAREMLDMTIDELSQRTRIRPHVLEAIELDDFAPCGGDFYARGHLTAISRVLGLSLDPLMKIYDEQYAQAPINARRVFEAELSTGLSGGMRATLGGPRWSLVVGAVLSLTLVWGLVRMFAGDPAQLNVAPEPGTSAAGLAANHTPITSSKMKTSAMTVTAAYAGTKVVVKDRTGRILWSGDLALGKHRKIVGLAPFKVSADNAGAVVVSVRGKPLGGLGTAGVAGSKSFG